MWLKVKDFSADYVKTVAEFFETVPDGWSEKALADSLENESIKSFVLEIIDGDVAAFASFLVADDAELVFIVTNEKYKRRGYGEMLLEQTLEKLNLPCVLEVRESNTPAVKLYEKLGFELLGKRKNFYQNPQEAALIYKKI